MIDFDGVEWHEARYLRSDGPYAIVELYTDDGVAIEKTIRRAIESDGIAVGDVFWWRMWEYRRGLPIFCIRRAITMLDVIDESARDLDRMKGAANV